MSRFEIFLIMSRTVCSRLLRSYASSASLAYMARIFWSNAAIRPSRNASVLQTCSSVKRCSSLQSPVSSSAISSSVFLQRPSRIFANDGPDGVVFLRRPERPANRTLSFRSVRCRACRRPCAGRRRNGLPPPRGRCQRRTAESHRIPLLASCIVSLCLQWQMRLRRRRNEVLPGVEIGSADPTIERSSRRT